MNPILVNEALKIWKGHAILREGIRNRVYLDSLGKPTVGIGHLVTKADNLRIGDNISNQRIDELFRKDTEKSLKTSINQCDILNIQDAAFLAALISVNFQLGDFSSVFKNSFKLLKERQFDQVIQNLRKSLWMKQTPVRVNDFIKAIEILKEKIQ